MRNSLLTILGALLAGCGGSDPVAENAAAPPPGVVGDAPGLPATNAAAAEAADRAAAPMAPAGMAWTISGDRARYGPPGAPSALSLQCDAARRTLVVIRNHPAPAGGRATLSLTGGGHVSSLPMVAVAHGSGDGDSHWQGSAAGDLARGVARPLAGAGPVEVSLGGAPNLVVPGEPRLGPLFARCG